MAIIVVINMLRYIRLPAINTPERYAALMLLLLLLMVIHIVCALHGATCCWRLQLLLPEWNEHIAMA